MRKEDLQDILRRIPPAEHTMLVLSLRSGANLTVSAVVRFEAEYLVMRGREGGTTDDGRGFFVPYADVIYIKFDRVIAAAELRRMYGETVAMDFEENMVAGLAAEAAAALPAAPATKVEPADPATIAKQNLLARIRAARTAGGTQPPSGT